MAGRLETKVAVITGGASGIGKIMAQSFIEEGARVIIADISGREEEAAAQLGSSARSFSADVSRSDDVKAMLDYAVASFGKLDILCNNAGLDGAQAPLADYDEEEFDRVIAVNLRGVFLGMRHAIPLMRANGGAIVNTASIAGSVVMPQMPAYCAAKAGVMQITKVAAVECAPFGIQVNTICPGVIQTPMVAELPRAFIADLEKATPAGRIAQPQEIANLALFLSSGEAPFLTGCSINIDGGYTLL
ncbi:SDR family oxidoreductase [Sphingobium phenoxybenzoativorans]|uniref:SDR family oxidoreductase n=1 Tax=Sphingobium phenoxybenzoativorans TaxID=1592790 RepID=A0A975K651_9SPHN|nr:SDR family NAD(P)-dependent oxidoreductase [Sphingobium phenoxybenzoativorans]QUT05506.1 SDR family oxidoreductase [Sphingobium phenoxybenzoativorans]